MTAEQALGLRDVLVDVMAKEAVRTVRVVAAITQPNYRPDERSRTAWQVALHLVAMDLWFADAIIAGAFSWQGEPPPPVDLVDPAALASCYSTELASRLTQLLELPSSHLLRDMEYLQRHAPAVRWLCLMNNHSVHHRGQLASYLRPMGSKVPALYGMSADESFARASARWPLEHT